MFNLLKIPIYTFFFVVIVSFNVCIASEWQKVYLASYPRSGNHWVRFLIEEATGIATSSVYQDIGEIDHDDSAGLHLPDIFPWGGYCTNHGYNGNCRYPNITDFVVIKTHYPYSNPPGKLCSLNYLKAVCLIRHPLDSFYSFFVYQNWLKTNESSYHIPIDQLLYYINSWKQFYEFWEKQENTVIIRYEDLYMNPHENFTKILKAIGNRFSEEDVQRAIKKYPPRGGINKHFHHFSNQEKKLIKQVLKKFLDRYEYEI